MMDFRAALAFSFLLVARASCAALPEEDRRGAANATAQLLRQEVRTVLDELANPGLLRNSSCPRLNGTELGEPEEQPVTARHLSAFRCYTLKASRRPQMSNLSAALPQTLRNICQYVDSMESLLSATDGPARQHCSLPPLDDMRLFLFVRCLLQRLDQRLSKATFSFH